MSGSAGGQRILREDVIPTITEYVEKVLNKYPNYKDCVITGSFNTSNKEDFGDIDLIVEVDANIKSEAKIEFIEFLSTISPYSMAFKSEKYKGKMYLNTGEIITLLCPIAGGKGYVQIDNIFSISPEETHFKNQFLSLPAIKQGLMLGLIKTVYTEDSLIHDLMGFDEAHELEFYLSSSGLTLKIVTLDIDTYKTLDSKDIAHYTDWNMVKELLKDYDFSLSFEELVDTIKNKLKNPRSINRVKGIFKSMVTVKSGEVGTPKGLEKEHALAIISVL